MIEMAIGLIIASVIVEIIIVASVDWLRDLLLHHGFLSLLFSIVLSWVLGTVFAAGGMIIFFSAIASSFITWIFYRILALIAWIASAD